MNYFRAHGLPFADPETVFTVRIGGEASPAGPLPTAWASFMRRPHGCKHAGRSLVLAEREPVNVGEAPAFFINGRLVPRHSADRRRVGRD